MPIVRGSFTPHGQNFKIPKIDFCDVIISVSNLIHLFIISRNASEKGPGETYQVKRFSHTNLKEQSARRSV